MAGLFRRKVEWLIEVRDHPPQPRSELRHLRRRIAEGAQQVLLRDYSRPVINDLNERYVRLRSLHLVAAPHSGEHPSRASLSDQLFR